MPVLPKKEVSQLMKREFFVELSPTCVYCRHGVAKETSVAKDTSASGTSVSSPLRHWLRPSVGKLILNKNVSQLVTSATAMFPVIKKP